MRFEATQGLRMGQQMKLAPRMIQSMEILQMAQAELEERIEQELENNPTLELGEAEADVADLRAERLEAAADARSLETPMEINGSGSDDFARLESFEADNPDYAGNTYDDDFHGSSEGDGLAQREAPARREFDDRHDGTYSASRLAGERDGKADALMAAPAKSDSLADQLRRQWGLVEVRADLRPLGEAIIDFLDEDGYLRTPLAEVLDRAPQAVRDGQGPGLTRPPTVEDLELALQAIQLLLEPAGLAARDTRECLVLQLDAMADTLGEEDGLDLADEPVVRHARVIVDEHLDDLLKNRLPKIAERTGLSLAEIRSALELMKRLSLAPARRLLTDTPEPITPDAIVEYDEDGDRYIAYLNDSRMPNLQVNREYALMAKDRAVPTKDRDFLKTNLGNATWLISAVEQRRNTLLRVIQVVVDEQRDYFDLGAESLRPLPMTQVAEQLGIHVATVSRAVNGKYLETPRGVVPLRSFFSGGLATESGDDMSYDAVRAALKEVVGGEDKAKPLSDDALAKALQDRGIEIARRTVAKYRGQLGIPSARMRKQFG